MSTIKLYRHALSGHSHCAQLFLSLLGLEVDLIDVDLAAGAHKQDDFLSKNAFGQVPVLAVLEAHLEQRSWLAGTSPTIADVENYAYIAHAPEGDVSLENYPSVRAWLSRVENLPGFVPMVETAVGLAA